MINLLLKRRGGSWISSTLVVSDSCWGVVIKCNGTGELLCVYYNCILDGTEDETEHQHFARSDCPSRH